MEPVFLVVVTVKLVGREKTVPQLTNKFIVVYPLVATMANTTLKQLSVSAIDTGMAQTVLDLFVPLIVVPTVAVILENVDVIQVGQENAANFFHVIQDVRNMVSAKTELVFVLKDGMEDIVRYLVVKMAAQDMDSVLWNLERIDVFVSMGGQELTAVYLWR